MELVGGHPKEQGPCNSEGWARNWLELKFKCLEWDWCGSWWDWYGWKWDSIHLKSDCSWLNCFELHWTVALVHHWHFVPLTPAGCFHRKAVEGVQSIHCDWKEHKGHYCSKLHILLRLHLAERHFPNTLIRLGLHQTVASSLSESFGGPLFTLLQLQGSQFFDGSVAEALLVEQVGGTGLMWAGQIGLQASCK